jgi:alkyl sulfatase BDS1-like metallo-beta-lactamase superfamily hydrolase
MKYSQFYLLIIIFPLFFSCEEENHKTSFEQELSIDYTLQKHSEEFKKEIIKVKENIYVAIGYGLANSTMIIGDEGIVIVDVMESGEAAKDVLSEFRKITNKPLKAIIYTHNHADHVFGSTGMVGNNKVDVYAHELTPYYLDRVANVTKPITALRGFRMFGVYLDDKALVNCGIGPILNINKDSQIGAIRPNKTFKDSLSITIEGINIELRYAPGETNDQLFVWLPDEKVLLPGDNIYKAFPNLYTIRGTVYRDPKQWTQSIDKMRAYDIDYLVPSHTRPVFGKDKIHKTLTIYRDGIQYVYDQTIRYMNKGFTSSEIVEKVHLPENLKNEPFLQEFYGKVSWSVTNIFHGNLGFFDGNPSTLQPLSPTTKAENIISLAGGFDKLMERASFAFSNQEYQWALELSDYLLRIKPLDKESIEIRYNSLVKLGEAESNPNARHYYLSMAKETKGFEIKSIVKRDLRTIHSIPLGSMFDNLSVNLIPSKCADMKVNVNFYFTDSNEKWSVQLRNSIAEAQNYHVENADITVTVKSTVWKELLSKNRNGLTTFLAGDLEVEPGISDFKEFMSYFEE